MLSPILSNIPDELKQYPRWVVWRTVPRKDDNRPTKPPYQPDGNLAKSNNPLTWSSFPVVKDAAPRFDGVGFVLTKESPFIGLDFDMCYCPAFNLTDPTVEQHIRDLNSYTEISPSGRGIRVMVKGKMPVAGKRKGRVEVYQSGRYVTITGHHLEGFPFTIENRQNEFDKVYQAVFSEPAKKNMAPKVESLSDIPPTEWKERLEKAFRSKNGSEIRRLWEGDHSAYASPSEADMALCSHLSFWLYGNPALVDAAFRQSSLYREKWDEKHYGTGETYGQHTINQALKDNNIFYKEAPVEEKNWGTPIPFDDYSLLPCFPEEMIPDVAGEMVRGLADSCQVDAGLPGVMLLAALSTVIGGKVKINLKSHIEPVNIYTIAVIGSGNRKSEIARQLASPIYNYQREKQEIMRPDIQRAQNQRKILEKRLEKLQKRAADEDDPKARGRILIDCDTVLIEIEAAPVPQTPVFIADDITPEALGQLMADNADRMSIITAEGGLFRIIAGLYHNGQANFDLFLKAHAGDFWSSNRIGRESKTMESPSLTLGLAVQPDVIEEIGGNSEFRGRGLSARFLYSLCESKAGYRTRQSASMAESIKTRYNKRITDLMELEGKYEISLSDDAEAVWDEFYNEIEVRMRSGGEIEHLHDWGSKLPGAVARIAGLLHFAEHGAAGIGKQISKNIVASSCAIGAYFLEHAKAIFGLMGEDERLKVARKILDFIKRHKPVSFKGRDLFNFTSCKSMKEITPGIGILIEREYIREMASEKQGSQPGRPESMAYEVNPKIFSNV